ncbi:MAG: hypothetical protein ACI4JM_05230 [Oscillospiraceae bacterium]
MEEKVKKELLKEMKTTDLIKELAKRQCEHFYLCVDADNSYVEMKLDLSFSEAAQFIIN